MKYSLSLLIFLLSLFLLFEFNQKTFSKGKTTEAPVTSNVDEPENDGESKKEYKQTQSKFNLKEVVESREVGQVIKNLSAIDDCLVNGKCYSQKDPKAHEAQAYRDIIKNLRYLRKNRYKNIKKQTLKRLSKKYLQYNHDYIKLEALQIMSAQNLKENDVSLIFQQVFSEPNPHSISYSMKMFSRQKDPVVREAINKNLYQVMTRGGVYPALEAVQNIDSVLNDSNRNYFEQALYEIEKQKISKRLHTELKKKLEL